MKTGILRLAILLSYVAGSKCSIRGSLKIGQAHEAPDYFRPGTYSSHLHRRLAAAPVDVLFVIDESFSMKEEQDDVRQRVKEIFNQLPPNSAVGLVGYGNEDDLIRLHTPLTTDTDQFRDAADALETDGGEEPGYMALVRSVSDDFEQPLEFRANRYCTILITDEPSNNDAGVTQAETIAALNGGTSSGLESVFIGITTEDTALQSYDDIADATGGAMFNLQDFRQDASFVLMPVLDACTVAVLDNIILDPAFDRKYVGEDHTITATVLELVGSDMINASVIEEGIFDPQQGILVTFEIISGPNQGTSGVCSANSDCTTDDAGMVNFTYCGDGGVGVDVIRACFTDVALGLDKCAQAEVELLDPPSIITLTQTEQERLVGDTHTISGNVIKGAGKLFYPAAWAGITFSIESGPNAGATGTCGDSNPSCETDGDGNIHFSYVGDGGDGTDVIKACVAGGNHECSTLEVEWKHPPVSDMSSDMPPTTERFVGETHTCVVTVTVSKGHVVSPLPGVSVNFTIGSGPNAGETGTCSPNADCTTGHDGKLEFSYVGDGGNGTDTITICFMETDEYTLSAGTKKCIIVDVVWVHRPITVIELSPANNERYTGDTHVVVASVVEDIGGVRSAAPGVEVNFNVKTGPNAGAEGSCGGEKKCKTDETGTISFSYEGNGGDGTDLIQACTTDLYDGSKRCDTSEVIWKIPGDPSATPTTAFPTHVPTFEPTAHPSVVPSPLPSPSPTTIPTVQETTVPTAKPSQDPSTAPTDVPTSSPSEVPVPSPSPTDDVVDVEQEDDTFPTLSPSAQPPSVDIAIRLDMPSTRPLLNETHVINCTVVELSDGEVTAKFPNIEVTFTILSGPNTGNAGSCSPASDCHTDEAGHVQYEYRGEGGVGIDVVEACCTISGSEICETTQVEWTDGEKVAEIAVLFGETCDTAKQVTVLPLAVFVCLAVICLVICCLYTRHCHKEDPNSGLVQMARVCVICGLIVVIISLVLLILANVEESGLC